MLLNKQMLCDSEGLKFCVLGIVTGALINDVQLICRKIIVKVTAGNLRKCSHH